MKHLFSCLLAALLCAAILTTGVLAEMTEFDLTNGELPIPPAEYGAEYVDEPVEEQEEFTIGDDSVIDEDGLFDADLPVDDAQPAAAERAAAEGSTIVITPDAYDGDDEGDDESDDTSDPRASTLSFGSPNDMDLEQAVAAAGPCLDGSFDHVVVFDARVDPTFQKEGLSEGAHCQVCGSVLVPQYVIPKVINLWMTLPSKGKYARTTLSRGDEVLVFADFATNAGYSVTSWTSSNPNVAEVTSGGVILCHNEGKATITVKTGSKKIYAKVPLKINDPYKPKKIKFTLGKSVSICRTQSIHLDTALEPLTAQATLTWTSSKPNVATVDQNGWIVGQSEGTTKITVKTHNGKKATIKVKVDGIIVNPNVHYRALLIGEKHFPGTSATTTAADKSVALIEKALKSVRGAEGNTWAITTRIDRTKDQIQSDIRSAFAGATDSDVSLFFINTHGDDETLYSQDYWNAGCLSTYPDAYGQRGLSLHRLASWLSEVPGKVVVLIDSCGSGAAIYGAKDGSDSLDPAAFNQMVIDAFADADKGVMAPNDRYAGAFVLENKFYVMTAAAYLESSWYLEKKYGYFAKWVSSAIKTKGKMPADSNKDKFLTLDELYRYVANKSEKKVFKDHGVRYKQHTQVYPANSGLGLFYRK